MACRLKFIIFSVSISIPLLKLGLRVCLQMVSISK